MPTGIYIRRKRIVDIQKHFWSKVKKTKKCWIWIAGLTRQGYGNFHINGKSYLAHRCSWKFMNGEIPGGMNILHHCDNEPCVNPRHLFTGTTKDNVRDSINKGRRKELKIGDNCKHGHLLVGENAKLTKKNYVFCKKCTKVNYKKYYDRKKEAK